MPKKVSLFIVVILLLALAVGMLAACTGENEDKKIVSIEFADGEWQTNYYLGQIFEPCEATITYDDGTTEVITVTAEMIRGFDTSKIIYGIPITLKAKRRWRFPLTYWTAS